MSGMDCYIVLIISQFLSSTQECTEKYLIDKEYISPFIVISLEGISGLAIVSGLIPRMSLISCSTSYIMCNEGKVSSSFGAIFKDIFEQEYVLWIIIFSTICSFSLNSFRLLINQHFSPLHLSLTYTFISFFMFFFKVFVFKLFKTIDTLKIILLLIPSFIMVFSVLIFLEIIVLNFWGLNTNTKKQIDMRKSIEYQEIMSDIIIE